MGTKSQPVGCTEIMVNFTPFCNPSTTCTDIAVFQIEIDLHRTAGRNVVKIIGHFGRNP